LTIAFSDTVSEGWQKAECNINGGRVNMKVPFLAVCRPKFMKS